MVFGEGGSRALAAMLLSASPAVKQFSVTSCQLTTAAVTRICEAIVVCKSIVLFDISGGRYRTACAAAVVVLAITGFSRADSARMRLLVCVRARARDRMQRRSCAH